MSVEYRVGDYIRYESPLMGPHTGIVLHVYPSGKSIDVRFSGRSEPHCVLTGTSYLTLLGSNPFDLEPI